MAIACHVVYCAPFMVNRLTGQRVDKNNKDTTIGETLNTEMRMLVIPDSQVPSSQGYPTIHEYIKAEAVLNFRIGWMDQTVIVTYGS